MTGILTTAVCLAALLTVSVLPVEAVIDIVDDPRAISADRVDVGRALGTTSCESRQASQTILEALVDARKIRIHQFDGRELPSFDAVKDYIRRLLSAVPEGDKLVPTMYWAEGRSTEIFGSVEFSQGPLRPFRVANGYAHVQDAAGCEWWGRYLGPDESKWVVRP